MNFLKQENESIIKEGKANRSSMLAAQGGKLYLTNKRVVFVGHGVNIGNGNISIDFDNILIYGKACTFTIFFPIPIPNAIKISTKDGKRYKFTVNGRKKWINSLDEILNR